MISVDLNNLDLTEFTGKTNPGLHCRATFPLFSAHGSENSATVYFELEPGDTLGWHPDSVEDLLFNETQRRGAGRALHPDETFLVSGVGLVNDEGAPRRTSLRRGEQSHAKAVVVKRSRYVYQQRI